MPIKVSLTALRAPANPAERRRMRGELAAHASAAALAVLEALVEDPASLLDDGRDEPQLAPGLGYIELDPCLVGYQPALPTRAQFDALAIEPAALARALARVVVDEKSTADPTLGPPDALVEQPPPPDEVARVRPPEPVAARPDPVDAPPASEPVPSPADEPTATAKMPEMTASQDIPADALTTRTEEIMVVPTAQSEEAGPEGRTEETERTAGTDETEDEVMVQPEVAAPESDAAMPSPGVTLTAAADDLFDAVPPVSRHFLALLDARGTLLMPEVVQHLGLVRPKGVGGAIEPIQRMARLMGVSEPFVADFDPSGYKRWTWTAPHLVEVPAELLDALPMPKPQAKKVKKKATRTPAKRDYKKQWSKGKKGAGARGARPARGAAAATGPGAAKGGKGRAAARRPEAAAARPAAPRTGQRPDAAAGRTGRAPAARPGAPAPAAAGLDRNATRRRRFDRPMPEVFRRGGRPETFDRPPPPRREQSGAARGEDTSGAGRISRSMPRIERPSYPSRAEKPARPEPARHEVASRPEAPIRPEVAPRVETPSRVDRVDTPARYEAGRAERVDSPGPARPAAMGRIDGPGGGRIDGPGAGRIDGPGGGRIDGPGGGRIDGPGGGRIDGPGGGRIDGPGGGRIDGPGGGRIDVPGRMHPPRVDAPVRADAPSPRPAAGPAVDESAPRRQAHSPEERLPLPRSGVFRRRTVSDTDVPVVVIRRRKP